MASQLRVDKSENRSGLGTITYTDTGAIVSGIVTANSFEGDLIGTATGLNATGDITIPDKIIHTGDTNTAIRFPGNDVFAIETAGDERLRIDSSGLVAIGHDTPSSFSSGANNLVVKDAAGAGGITIVTPSSAEGAIFFADGTSGSGQGRVRYDHSDDSMHFSTAGTERFRIDSTGIGTYKGNLTFGVNSKAKLFENGNQQGIQCTHSGSSAHLMTHDGAEDIHVDPSGYIMFEVGGSERLRIGSNGKTGVNAGSSYAALTSLDIRHHAGTSGTGTKQSVVTICAGRNSARGLEILTGQPTTGNQNDAGVYYNAKDTESSAYHAQHVWQLGGNNAMVLGYTGKSHLGVGVDSPASALHALDSSATETNIIRLRNYKSGVNTKPTLLFEASSSGNQGANSSIQGLAGTDAGGSNSANDSGMKFIVRHGGAGTEREAFTIKKDGNIHFPNGQGISFAATADTGTTGASTTSELFDDYEEGSWTPTLYAWNGTQNQGYDTQTGNYIKIGNQVHANFTIDLNSKGTVSGNYTFIGGLPYTHAGVTGGSGTMVAWGWAMGSNIGWIAGDISSTNTVCWVTYVPDVNNNTGYLPASMLYDNSQIKGTLIYRSS